MSNLADQLRQLLEGRTDPGDTPLSLADQIRSAIEHGTSTAIEHGTTAPATEPAPTAQRSHTGLANIGDELAARLNTPNQ